MDTLPEAIVGHIGSFLSAKGCASCRLAARVLRPVCHGVKDHAVNITADASAETLGQRLAVMLTLMPCLQRCSVSLSNVTNVVRAAGSISMPGVVIELSFNCLCSEAAIDSVIDWFVHEPEVTVGLLSVSGKEVFLRHRIMRLNTAITPSNAGVLKHNVISRIPRLYITVYAHHLDLSGICIQHNIDLVIIYCAHSFSCTDPWKITELMSFETSGDASESFKSMQQDPMMSKSSRLKQIILYDGDDNPFLSMAKALPKRVKWLIQPNGPAALATIRDLKNAGVDNLGYQVCCHHAYLDALLMGILYPGCRFGICVDRQIEKLEIISVNAVQDIFNCMVPQRRTKWLAVESLLTADQLARPVCVCVPRG